MNLLINHLDTVIVCWHGKATFLLFTVEKNPAIFKVISPLVDNSTTQTNLQIAASLNNLCRFQPVWFKNMYHCSHFFLDAVRQWSIHFKSSSFHICYAVPVITLLLLVIFPWFLQATYASSYGFICGPYSTNYVGLHFSYLNFHLFLDTLI